MLLACTSLLFTIPFIICRRRKRRLPATALATLTTLSFINHTLPQNSNISKKVNQIDTIYAHFIATSVGIHSAHQLLTKTHFPLPLVELATLYQVIHVYYEKSQRAPTRRKARRWHAIMHIIATLGLCWKCTRLR